MNQKTDLLVASSLDKEPLAYRGLSRSELQPVLLASLAVSLAVGLIVGFLIHFILTVVVTLLGALIVFEVTARRMVAAKEGKPPGYHLQMFSIFMAKKIRFGMKFIRSTCYWHLKRSGKV